MRLYGALALVFLVSAARAQVATDSDLYARILAADGALFERGFNQCDRAALDEILSPGFRFVHDQNGLTESRAQFLKGFEESICSNPQRKPIRLMVPASMQVFALRNEGKLYGAIQMVRNRYMIREPGKALYQTSSGRVTNLWLLEEGQWRLRESLSYDHRDTGAAAPR
jgi:hypothetical protein